MRNKIAVTLLVASLAVPAFAAVKSDPDRRSSDRTTIARVVNALKRFVGIGSKDDLQFPRP
jgi:hypothetical protein